MRKLVYVNACARRLGERPFAEPSIWKLMRLRAFPQSFPWLRGWRAVELEHSSKLVVEARDNPYHERDHAYGLIGTKLNRLIFSVPAVPALCLHTYHDVYLIVDRGKFCLFRTDEFLAGCNSLPMEKDFGRAHRSPDFTIAAGAFCGDRFSPLNPAHDLDHLARGIAFRDLAGMDEDTIFVETGGSPYAEFMTSLVLPKARRFASGAVYLFKQLFVLSSTFGDTGHPLYYLDDFLLRSIRNSVLNWVSAGRTKCVYLARFDTRRRVLENEHALAQALQSRGFEVLVMSQLSPEEQLATIRGASAIVAPHGASLANLIAAGERPSVFELLNPDCGTLAFAGLSQALSASYHPIVGTPVDRNNRQSGSRWTMSIPDVIQRISSSGLESS